MKKPNTAHMKENCRCVKCGWPIIFTCCNDDMQRLPWGMWDWWMYCSNKGCIHHEGEGVFQETPDWVEVIENA